MCNQALPYAAVQDRPRRLGVPDDLAPAFWDVARENITRLDDLAAGGPVPRRRRTPIAPEDAEFVAQALALLPPPPYGPTAWADWTAAVKGDRAQGQGPVHAAAQGADRAGRTAPTWRR
jgi:glutamyl-tRNA synthetase